VSPEQFTAIIVAITGLVTALGAIFVQLRQTHNLINSRMTQLVAETKLAAQKDGELAGRDQERARAEATVVAEGRNVRPIDR